MHRFLTLILITISFSLFSMVPSQKSKHLDKSSFMLISGNSNPVLAEEVANILGVNVDKSNVARFNDGEIKIQIEESIRGKDVYILQSTCSTKDASVNDNLMELYLLIRACKRASAKSIIAVMPYFGYARQDRKSKSRVPISASDVAMILELAGANHVIALDLHSGQIQGFFHNISVDNLSTSVVFVPYIARRELDNLVVVAPDTGAIKRAKNFQLGLNSYGIHSELAVIVKQRIKSGVAGEVELVGNVKGCDVIIVDDICDTARTLVKAAKELRENGAKKIYGCITHPVFSKNAISRIQASAFDELIVTDTIPLNQLAPPNIRQISIAPLIAEAIRRSQNGESLSYLFKY